MHDLIIIGAGPAGLSAAIYASRAELDYILIEENFVNGGQIGDTISFRDNGDCTGTWDPEGMSWKMIPITLKEGNTNTVAIQSFDDLWAPNFDRITIHPVLSDDDITGIPSPTTETDKAIYALNGCKLPGLPQKGIFIKDGKKVLVK